MGVLAQRILAGALGVGLALCLYLAWRPSPFLTEVGFIPHEFARWADGLFNLRTVIPFIGLGFVGAILAAGSWLRLRVVLLSLFAFSALLEFGQLFIATRHPNFEDVFFGSLGSLIGILIAMPLFLFQRSKQIRN